MSNINMAAIQADVSFGAVLSMMMSLGYEPTAPAEKIKEALKELNACGNCNYERLLSTNSKRNGEYAEKDVLSIGLIKPKGDTDYDLMCPPHKAQT